MGWSWGSLLQAMASALWLPQAACLAYAVQRLADAAAQDAAGWRIVAGPAALLLLLGLLRAALEGWGLRRVFRQARAGLSQLREQVAAALALGSPLDRARPASGLAASAIAEQAEAVVPYLTRYQPARLRVMVLPLLILAAVSPLSWAAALVLLLAAPLIPLFMALVGWRAQAASEAQMVEMGGMSAFLLDRLRGLATVRALDAVQATAQRLDDAAQSLRQRTLRVLRIAFLSSAVLELFSALGVAMVAVYVGFHLLGQLEFGAWGRRLSLGEGLFILLLAPAFFEPLRELSAVWHDRAAGEAALQALRRLGEARPALLAAPGSGGASAHLGADRPAAVALRIEGLRFAYPGTPAPVFGAFGLQVAPGEHVAVMGGSGCGKSTLLALIAGLAPVQAGRIEIDGVPLSAATADGLRECMAWIGQRPHVFAGSVQANVALGRPGVGAAQVRAALQAAALERVAQAHPGTGLGEGGAGLSGGEAVRLALARAAAWPQAGLLLADEPTAHLDAQTAHEVTQALLLLARGRTLIVATHDPVLAARLGRQVRLDMPQEPA
ncbi:thiol reductant ABC exporter subunit CydD [Variovorax terrae]|uniref:Thiol reductant ABC exporter subunit CydD n=1 Tax=Variovorax terrae TaxID=2923278 RepID=A0A9X1VTN7_9BURK|nr:thiol reductant ABC exporter subunit CydD [Variovorax terrae]MCJ0762720.1 thiol reductant ABC exporter subunit CydD [Variovorax terrae]